MITIVAGSRDATQDNVLDALERCPWLLHITEVVSGCARGADTFGETWALSCGLPVRRMPADWTRHGRRAGVMRNEDMAKVADALIAVWDGVSVGTRHMISVARARGLRVHVWQYVRGLAY